MASKTKIYVVMEYVTGGELFNRIVSKIPLFCSTSNLYFDMFFNEINPVKLFFSKLFLIWIVVYLFIYSYITIQDV